MSSISSALEREITRYAPTKRKSRPSVMFPKSLVTRLLSLPARFLPFLSSATAASFFLSSPFALASLPSAAGAGGGAEATAVASVVVVAAVVVRECAVSPSSSPPSVEALSGVFAPSTAAGVAAPEGASSFFADVSALRRIRSAWSKISAVKIDSRRASEPVYAHRQYWENGWTVNAHTERKM